MIPKKRLYHLFVCLTLGLLAACEPLAPAQTPNVIVVTGVTPDVTSQPTATPPFEDTTNETPSPDSAISAGGPVSTATPSLTPTRVLTATPTATPFNCEETNGQVIASSITSEALEGEFNYQLYLPPCFYQTLQRYPYVVLLHGTGYDETMWEELGAVTIMDQGIANGTLPPMVLVMPNGDFIAELNDQPEDRSYETIILDELIPALETDFCLWGNRDGRAIGGISRGGFWAFSIAFRHPELFSALGGHSPHFEVDNASPENNPLDLATNLSVAKLPMRIYIDHGVNDYVATNAQGMSEILTSNDIEHEYHTYDVGDHDMDYWTSHAAEYLAFYGQVWPTNIAELPSCLEPSPVD